MEEKIIRGLFHEREKIAEGKTEEFFNKDVLAKILRLMEAYSINTKIMFSDTHVQSIPVFLDRLSYYLPEGELKSSYDLNQIYNFFINSNLNEFSSIIELFTITLNELENNYLGRSNITYGFIDEFNNLLAL